MLLNPVTLIDETIENLQLLSEVFTDDLAVMRQTAPQARMHIETVTQLKQAISALQSARATQNRPHGAGQQPTCANCDDF
jgi:hypothetical protein